MVRRPLTLTEGEKVNGGDIFNDIRAAWILTKVFFSAAFVEKQGSGFYRDAGGALKALTGTFIYSIIKIDIWSCFCVSKYESNANSRKNRVNHRGEEKGRKTI